MSAEPYSSEFDLLMALNSADAEVSLEAARHLRTLPPSKIGSLVRGAIHMQVSAPHRIIRLSLIPLVAVVALYAIAGRASLPAVVGGVVIGTLCLAGTCIMMFKSPGPDLSKCYDCLAIHISSLSTADALPAVISLLTADNASTSPTVIRRAVYTAAKNILPTLTDREFGAPGADTLCSLAKVLSNPYADSELSVLIIALLARRSDPFELDLRNSLMALASQSAVTENMKSVRAASQQALAQLAERREEHIVSQSLVRASDCPNPKSELLRPTSAAASQPDELVRPAEWEPDPAERPRPG